MYLKRIEAIGFKSFATKTVISFDKGLTAIVGPNGSGKSNVSDSIRFVLGEQSVKSLRGGKMEDIIFAGTDHKKALNIAEVTIVLDNQARKLPLDFSEVSITRRVYRSGGGEYLINGEKTRLKDVTDLIMDSGIGHDSLSMISQDQVKQVIEGKPEERRLILEESAGILKYKNRKKEAVRKLEHTNENLRRVSDITAELENQIGPLQSQAKQAREYQAIKTELADLEIRVLAYDIKIDADNLTQLKKENADLTVEMLELTKQTQAGDIEQTELTKAHNDLTHLVQDLQFELTNHAENVQKKRGEAELIKERIANAASNQSQLAGRQAELKSNLTTLQAQLEATKTKSQEASIALYAKKQADKKTYHANHIAPLEEQLHQANKNYHQASQTLASAQAKLASINDESQQTTYQLATAKSQLGFLLDAKRDFAGFSEGAKQVLRACQAGKLTGIEGAMAALVSVPSAYETAFDVILGPIAHQIVTQNDSFARAAIKYLKENRYGRATFLPMNIIKTRRLAPNLLNKAKSVEGFIALASDALTFDLKYTQIIENLVGRVVIASDLTVANQMAKITAHQFRIVTLDGDVINPGGSMTGGRVVQNSSSVLKQNQQITKQQALITTLEATVLDLEANKQQLQPKIANWQAKEQEANQLVQELKQQLTQANEASLKTSYELKIEVATLEANLQSQMNEVNRLNFETERVQNEITAMDQTFVTGDETQLQLQAALTKIETEIVQSDDEKTNITTTIRDHRTQLVAVTAKLKELENQTREARRMINEVNGALNQLSGAIGKLDVKIEIAISKLEGEHEMTFDHAVQNFPLNQDVARAKSELQTLNQQLSRFGTVNLGAIEEYERVKERYDFLMSESDDLKLAANNIQASINEMDVEMVTKFKATFDLVRTHYIATFIELFGGGQADLTLTQPSDLLNTGVEIIARPPGTKLGTSTLLSGGQKALTSIAMLFAILKVRTIPFCILDEVEAALDEANVARYAKYLKHFSDQTQFIVITHRRGTMEEADILYGVTMQERGVTSMVSVRMDAVDNYLDQ